MTCPPIFVALKAFGDLVIAATALESAPEVRTPGLLIGSHLLPLASALDIRVPWVVLQLPESGVPAMYDVRRCGIRAGACSLLQVRRSFRRAALSEPLLFDRVGLREHILAFPDRPLGLPAAPNIYLAYRALVGDGQRHVLERTPTGLRRIGIFPGSRILAKNIPVALVDAAHALCEAQGWQVSLYLLDGERPDLQTADRTHIVVPRKFEAMIAAVAECDAVISADSLPAHLAERAQRPVFVLSPVENRFWFPLSAYETGRYSLFHENVNAPAFRHFVETTSSTFSPVPVIAALG